MRGEDMQHDIEMIENEIKGMKTTDPFTLNTLTCWSKLKTSSKAVGREFIRRVDQGEIDCVRKVSGAHSGHNAQHSLLYEKY